MAVVAHLAADTGSHIRPADSRSVAVPAVRNIAVPTPPVPDRSVGALKRDSF